MKYQLTKKVVKYHQDILKNKTRTIEQLLVTRPSAQDCCIICALLTKREVNMAEDWPRTETKSWSRNAQKETWPTYSHLDRTSLVNEEFFFVMAIDRIFFSGTKAGNPERAHVIRPGSQSERTEFASSCPLTVSASGKPPTQPSLKPSFYVKSKF